jgi:D-aminopeptidase
MTRPRARDLGIVIGLVPPGPNNAITDVEGVRVGHTTLIEGDSIRTGVTVVAPPLEPGEALYGGFHSLNGNGEMTGTIWLAESGLLTTPIGITNTHSVGVVHDALIAAEARQRGKKELYWSLPIVAETFDGALNDINGQHVRAEHVFAALDGAKDGPVGEGNVGGGTGMICHEFKGGIGTSSRVVQAAGQRYTVGALVQANYGIRERLTIAGRPIGRSVPYSVLPSPWAQAARIDAETGSIIVIVATDAPLLPNDCRALAQRAGLGLARVGGGGGRTSGDIFLAFSTGNRIRAIEDRATFQVTTVGDDLLSPLYWGAIESTEEAIVNALVAAEPMTGRDGITAHALPHETLRAAFGGAG